MTDGDLTFVHLHIHKTAGTTLQSWLKQQQPQIFQYTNAVVNFWEGKTEYQDMNHRARRHMRVVSGHVVNERMMAGTGRPYFAFTFLREPVDRVVSWYSYEVAEHGLQQPFEGFVRDRSNQMSHMLVRAFPSLVADPGASLGERAASILRRFNFVGDQATFGIHVPELLDRIGAPPIPADFRRNTGPRQTLDYDRAMVAEHNSHDTALYREFFPPGSTGEPYRSERLLDPLPQTPASMLALPDLVDQTRDLHLTGHREQKMDNDRTVAIRRLVSLYLLSSGPEREALAPVLRSVADAVGVPVDMDRLARILADEPFPD